MKTFDSALSGLSKDDLIRLIEYYSRAFTALDGLWFNKVQTYVGDRRVREIDQEVWSSFYPWEAKKLRKFLNIRDSGIKGVIRAITFTTWIHCMDYKIAELSDQKAVITFYNCPVLNSLERAGAKTFPCIEASIVGKALFAIAIDPEVTVHCTIKPPRKSRNDPACQWEFHLRREPNHGGTGNGVTAS